MKYVGVTFSPSMIKSGTAKVFEVPEDVFKHALEGGFISAVGHANTAEILSRRFKREIKFNRINIELNPGDILLCAIPQVRFDVAREYSDEEVANAPFRFFAVEVVESKKEVADE